MDYIMAIAEKYNLTVVEDAAQAIDSFYKSKPLGSIGHLGCFSFHETKNIQCGEGGMLVINNEHFLRRAEIIWEKGTNRAEFFRGEINKYGWVDIGSSFLPSELIAAFLWSQIEKISEIQRRRLEIWQWYNENASTIFQGFSFSKPFIPSYATNNAHMFYLILNSLDERTRFINQLKLKNVLTVFHYLSLHKSPFYINKHDNRSLPNSDHYEECLVRLPLFYELNEKELLSSVI
jgi:dTDP-4-amino-4,6-dideoxygalactose transaminase